MLSLFIYGLALGIPLLFLIRRRALSPPQQRPAVTAQTDDQKSLKTIMQPPRDNLDPPKSDPYKLSELAQYDGSDPSKPIYVSIKGDVFDVTRKQDVYGKGKSYNIFAGKDGSRGLGKSSLKVEDAVPDYSVLPENEMKVLDDWHAFFSKRYNIVGRVVDMPDAVSNKPTATL
ncbi:cytochrome b5 [Melanogaster broomeanus]|nr:cytochrome b5 [Melanogaster broomeanus]